MMTGDHRLFCRGAPKTPGCRPDFVHERIAYHDAAPAGIRHRYRRGAGPTTPTPDHPLTSLGPSAFSLLLSPCDLPTMSRHLGGLRQPLRRVGEWTLPPSLLRRLPWPPKHPPRETQRHQRGAFNPRRPPLGASRHHFRRTRFGALLAIPARDFTSTKRAADGGRAK
jgi:hypothetical protein